MKPATKDVIRAVLLGDDTVSPGEIDAILARLDGDGEDRQIESGKLLTATAAAKSLGFSRTWFWRKVTRDQIFNPLHQDFPPNEVTPGRYRYLESDIEAYKKRTGNYKPVRYKNLKTKKHIKL